MFGRYTDSQFLDPVHTTQNPDIWLSLTLYDTLLLASADGTSVEPGLASAWKVAQDGKTVTFTMRPGIKFSDGSPIELSDVKWSLDRGAREGVGRRLLVPARRDRLGRNGGSGTKWSSTCAHPDPVILQALATFNSGIMPEKLLMAAPGATLNDKSKAFAEHPVGSGPFMLTSWQHNTEMVMSRNPYYWKTGADGQKLPYLDAIKFLIIPDDATRILKLKAGELDIAEFVPYSRVAELKGDPNLNTVLFPAAQTNYFAFNNRPTLKDGTKNPLADVRVRQALNYATDKDALIQVVTYAPAPPRAATCRCRRRSPTARRRSTPTTRRKPRRCCKRPGTPTGSISPAWCWPAAPTTPPSSQPCSSSGARSACG